MQNIFEFRYFIGYKEDYIFRPLCIILLQMSGYIKYFENGGKNMSFSIKDDDVLVKYNEIWDKIKYKKFIARLFMMKSTKERM